ncbi:MAG: KEOPS complex subunit Pcc1 [Candidatus Bathyarchaeia archaeon]
MEEASARIWIETPQDITRIIAEALKPEAETPSSSRSRVNLQPFTGGLLVEVEASDTAALRAAMNSYLHWIGEIMDILERLSDKGLRERRGLNVGEPL